MNKKTIVTSLIILGVAGLGVVLYMNWPLGQSQGKPKVAIFNLVSHPILDESIEGIKEALAEEGFGPDRLELVVVNANGDMDKLNAFSKELLAGNPDVIVPVSTPVTQAVFREAPKTQKIVFSTVTNPADVGMDKHPPNMTGVCDAVNYQANMDLILELFPKTKRIGMVYNAGERNSQFGVDRFKELAVKRGIHLQLVTVANSQEVVDAVRALVGNVDLIYVGSDNTVVTAMPGLTKVAYASKVPVIASDVGSVKEGALAAVSVDYKSLGRRAGKIIAQTLKTGKLPEDRDPVMFLGDTLILNEQAAGRIGFEFPGAVVKRAGQVIR